MHDDDVKLCVCITGMVPGARAARETGLHHRSSQIPLTVHIVIPRPAQFVPSVAGVLALEVSGRAGMSGQR